MNYKPQLFEELYEAHLSLQNDYTNNSRFYSLPV